MTPITKLKQSEYHKGAIFAFENFESLLEISEKAAEIGNFGAASSLCILAIEELSKSGILQLKSINSLIPINDLDKYFWYHELKQNAGLDLYIKLESIGKENNVDSKTLIAMAVAVIAIICLVYTKQKDGEKNKKKDKSYFDSIKESGFYVGYDESTRNWESPKNEHDQDSYDNLLELTKDFAEKVKNWIFNGKINSENIIGFLYTLDDEIINKERLDKIK
jgi:AbiV family abortive infection protein